MLHPALYGVVIMRANVADVPRLAVMRQIIRISLGVKGELQNAHSREARIAYKLPHAVRQHTEILRNVAHMREPPAQYADKPHAGAAHPIPALGALRVGGDRPEAFKAAEMVDPQHIVELARAVNAAYPPAVAVCAHTVPIVQRIAPELPLVGEGVRRTARDKRRHIIPIQHEEMRLAPHVGRVERDIYRDIAYKLHAVSVRVGAQRVPLLIKKHLHKAMILYFILQKLTVSAKRVMLPHSQRPVVPFHPCFHAEISLCRHIQGIVLYPEAVPAERRGLVGISFPAALKSLAQKLLASGAYLAIVGFRAVVSPIDGFYLILFQKTAVCKHIKVYVIGITGVCGKRGIRAVAAACWHKREKLPVFLSGVPEKVHKFISALPHCADSPIRRKRAQRHKYSAAS